MPGLVQSYDVLLDFTNDTHDYTSLQLLRDYNSRNGNTAGAVLIPPGETVTLVLDAGSVYKYVLKTCTKVASVTYVPVLPLHPKTRARRLEPIFWRSGGYFISEPGSKLTRSPLTRIGLVPERGAMWTALFPPFSSLRVRGRRD